MTYDASHEHLNATDTLYVLPESEDVGSTNGLIAGVYNAGAEEPNTYDFTGLIAGVNYYVYVQADASPAEGDAQDALIIGPETISEPVTIDYGTLSTSLALQLKRLSVRASEIAPSTLTLTRGTTWRIPLGILPAGWTRVEFTARRNCDEQSSSLLHVVLSSPASGSDDGLRIVCGKPAVDPAGGRIVPGDDETAAVCVIDADQVTDAPLDEFCFDAKVDVNAGVDLLARGELIIERDITRTAE